MSWSRWGLCHHGRPTNHQGHCKEHVPLKDELRAVTERSRKYQHRA